MKPRARLLGISAVLLIAACGGASRTGAPSAITSSESAPSPSDPGCFRIASEGACQAGIHVARHCVTPNPYLPSPYPTWLPSPGAAGGPSAFIPVSCAPPAPATAPTPRETPTVLPSSRYAPVP
jgi:hypothetical protein